MLVHIFRHIDSYHILFRIKQRLAEGLSQFRLSNICRSGLITVSSETWVFQSILPGVLTLHLWAGVVVSGKPACSMQVLCPCGALVVSSAFLIKKIMLLYALFIVLLEKEKATQSSILA